MKLLIAIVIFFHSSFSLATYHCMTRYQGSKESRALAVTKQVVTSLRATRFLNEQKQNWRHLKDILSGNVSHSCGFQGYQITDEKCRQTYHGVRRGEKPLEILKKLEIIEKSSHYVNLDLFIAKSQTTFTSYEQVFKYYSACRRASG